MRVLLLKKQKDEGICQVKRLDGTIHFYEAAEDWGEATMPNFPLDHLEHRKDYFTKKSERQKEKKKHTRSNLIFLDFARF